MTVVDGSHQLLLVIGRTHASSPSDVFASEEEELSPAPSVPSAPSEVGAVEASIMAQVPESEK